MIAARFPPGLIEEVETWARYQKTSRSDAIRRLVEIALKAAPKAKKGK